MKPETKRKTLRISLSCLGVLTFLSLPIVGLVCFHEFSGPVYQETYYGEFLPLNRILKSKTEKKVVVIGTSSVPFGFDSALFEEECLAADMGYQAIGYGLYGSLGTRLMMETALPEIKEGDIVILAPELYPQTLSNYFSGIETYRAIEQNKDILPCLSNQERGSLALALPSFVAEKNQFLLQGKKAEGSGIYVRSSFDEKGNLKGGLREGNVMDGYWGRSTLSIDPSLFAADFVDYLNDFCQAVKSKGASPYYRLCPLNQLAMAEDYQAKADAFYDWADAHIKAPYLGDPHDSIILENYFYDSDFHLNDAGRTLNTLRILSALKTELGVAKPNVNPEPLPPELPKKERKEIFGDDKDASCFLYEEKEDGLSISGISDEGKAKESLVLPTHADTKFITGIQEGALDEAKELVELRVQPNIEYLPDRLFAACPDFRRLHIEESDPSSIHVGWYLLEGAPSDVAIYVPKGSLQRFRLDYFWSHYVPVLVEESA